VDILCKVFTSTGGQDAQGGWVGIYVNHLHFYPKTVLTSWAL